LRLTLGAESFEKIKERPSAVKKARKEVKRKKG